MYLDECKVQQEQNDMSLERFRLSLADCHDVIEYKLTLDVGGPVDVIMFYCDGLIDNQQLQLGLLPQLEKWANQLRNFPNVENGEIHKPSMLFSRVNSGRNGSNLYARLFAGSVILSFGNLEGMFEFDIADQPGRNPEESTMEVSIRGPRDGFVELLATNVALVRKRLRTPDMHVEYSRIGSESLTEIALIYMEGKAASELVAEARRRLDQIDIPSLSGGSQLEELLSDRRLSLFPLVEYVGRPDYVVQSLLQGKVAILLDGSPSAIIAPGNLLLLIKSPEDAHLPYYYVSLGRLLRLVGLVFSLCLPGFWIALSTFNTDQIPFSLLATITISRIGLPISATMEMFLMLTMFELFREAGVRLPRAVGQTVSVVGGLIVGDAAIRAGMTSPTMLVMAAVTAVSTFTLVNQSLSGSVSVIRYLILICSSVLGIFGFFVGTFAVIIYLCTLESFGRSYLEPLAPLRFKQLIPAIFQMPWKLKDGRRSK
ncbi:spore germination protein [Paenibacillus sp. FSL H8-0548]|uniref:spore germination protein n=1 Tax=Paenibacillus sp. FSL H8-0548 TaxID=1920422 RepID=UPI00096C9C0B|nr:spore germination protein [Paenibacillus sp. FSL H8-0548]OMF35968.1 spore germination protein [Paenibacillus sp. FSL H8-0548]